MTTDNEDLNAGAEADRIAELEQDNRRLRRLLDQRDAPGELRHRLHSTLALLRGVIRKSADTGRDLPDYVAHLEDRLDATVRAQAFADQHGEVDLHALIADELLPYGAAEDGKLAMSGPAIRLKPKAGQLLALAIHELAVNAVEHGALGAEHGRVEISWSVIPGEAHARMVLVWTEHGLAPGTPSVEKHALRGFGTEVLTRMLAYDLKSETDIAFDPGGLRCTIRLPLPEQVGRLEPDRSVQ